MTSELSSLCSYAKGKVSVDTLSKRNYVSTENMVPNKGGIVDAGALPSAQYTQQYMKDDILVSNIRPYFKKIWMADDDGGCSNDVLVFRAECGCDSTFLYYVLAIMIPKNGVRLLATKPIRTIWRGNSKTTTLR